MVTREGIVRLTGLELVDQNRSRLSSGELTPFIERLWRSLKYEAICLHELTDGFKAEQVIGEWIVFYNTERGVVRLMPIAIKTPGAMSIRRQVDAIRPEQQSGSV